MNDASTHSVKDKKDEHQPRRPPLRVFLNFFLVPYPYSLFLFSSILAAILFSSSDLSVLGLEKAVGALFQCIATGYITWAVIYSYHILKEEIQTFASLIVDALEGPNPKEAKNKWVVDEINLIYNGMPAYLIFALFATGLFSTVVFVIGNPLPHSLSTPFYITFAVFSLVAGFGGSTVFLIGRFMIWYANRKLSVSIFQYPHSQFRFIGQLQFKFALITAGGYFFAAAMTVFYWGIQPITIFWLFVGIAFVIGFFLFPQRGFHKQLRDKKLKEMKDLSEKIQRVYGDTIREPNTENIKKLKEMHELADLISKLPVWPFDAKSLLSVMATVIIPVIIMFQGHYLMFLQTLIKFFFGGKG